MPGFAQQSTSPRSPGEVLYKDVVSFSLRGQTVLHCAGSAECALVLLLAGNLTCTAPLTAPLNTHFFPIEISR